jgi:hypothetical protein
MSPLFSIDLKTQKIQSLESCAQQWGILFLWQFIDLYTLTLKELVIKNLGQNSFLPQEHSS